MSIEDKVYDEQYKLIKKKYGKDTADMANYGWGVTGGESWVEVSTKVYGHGVLTSHGNRQRIKHYMQEEV
jgi:hypothetical protein